MCIRDSCNIASKRLNNPLGSHDPIHPNDHVNCSQSTNDVFPAAIQVATIVTLKDTLIPELTKLIDVFHQKSKEWKDIIKLGRTHLQDAVPLTLGQEVSAWAFQLETALRRIEINLEELYPLPLGGTAIGTGLNTPKNFDNLIALDIARKTKASFCLTTKLLKNELPKSCVAIIVDNVLVSTSKITSLFYPTALNDNFDGEVNYPNKNDYPGLIFGKNVLFGKNVSFGKNCTVGHNTIIERNVVIGNNCNIGSNVILKNTIIGNRTNILDGAIIGKKGFGFFPGKKINIRYPHIGAVITVSYTHLTLPTSDLV